MGYTTLKCAECGRHSVVCEHLSFEEFKRLREKLRGMMAECVERGDTIRRLEAELSNLKRGGDPGHGDNVW